MKYALIAIVEHTETPILDDDGKSLVIGVPNSLNLTKGDELVVGSAKFEIVKRSFNVASLGAGVLYVEKTGTALDIKSLVLGTTATFI